MAGLPNPVSLGLPSIDQNLAATWTQDDLNYYNKLPYYFVKATGAWQKRWETWSKILKSVPWQANMGDTMRQVGLEPSPVLRQQAFPKLLAEAPKGDIIHLKERTTDAKLRRQRFTTPNFHFLPSFQDFMGQKVGPYRENLNRQVSIYAEQFYRTHMFHWSPYVYVAGVGLLSAPSAEGSADGSTGKSNGFLATEVLNKVSTGLSFQEVFKALNLFEQEVGATPFEGDGQPGGDSQPLNEKYLLVGASEVWNNWIDDPWLKENRPINMNIVTQGFQGDLFGRARFRTEKFGIRIKHDNNFLASYPAPEYVELNANSPELFRTKPNKAYATESQVGVAWLVGGNNYQYIEVGAPPASFTEKDVNGLVGMDWNGKIQMTKNILTMVTDDNGNQMPDTNSWGEYLRLQAQVALGIVGFNKFNVMPIFYKRNVGITTIL